MAGSTVTTHVVRLPAVNDAEESDAGLLRGRNSFLVEARRGEEDADFSLRQARPEVLDDVAPHRALLPPARDQRPLVPPPAREGRHQLDYKASFWLT